MAYLICVHESFPTNVRCLQFLFFEDKLVIIVVVVIKYSTCKGFHYNIQRQFKVKPACMCVSMLANVLFYICVCTSAWMYKHVCCCLRAAKQSSRVYLQPKTKTLAAMIFESLIYKLHLKHIHIHTSIYAYVHMCIYDP